jgi:AraC family transcriptional regulator
MDLKLAPGRFYGDTLRMHEVAGFGLTETIYPPHFKIPQHSHERPYFGLVLWGTYAETYGNKARTCKPSMLVYHPSDEVHSQHFYQTEGRIFRMEVCPQWLRRLNERVLIQNKSADFFDNLVCQLAARLYYEFRELDEVSPLVIEGLALEIVGEVSRPATTVSKVLPPHWLQQARELIHARSFECLTLSEIALTVSIHPVYLAREFRRHYHCTVGEYIRRLRIEAACREMIRPDASLAEIAVACGFHDQSHFSKTFKRLMNVTPAAYRARLLSH